jgi:nicotinate-nucleotide--dimethylbenzimidazole phosphoribosyltransferase
MNPLPRGDEWSAVDDGGLEARVLADLDAKTKPRGSLGRIESLALQLALIQGTSRPSLRAPQLVVFAGDHGIAAHGVSAYPREVTRQMVSNFLAGGAAVSVIARQHGIDVIVADCGVDAVFEPHPNLRDVKVAGAERGTADSTGGPAMARAQCTAAIARGRELVASLPGNALLLGEMGIGNTSSATLLMTRLTGEPLHVCIGRGTGLDDHGMKRKRLVLRRSIAANATALEPIDVLAAFGGFEIAAMVGATLQAALERRVVVVDGFIATAAVAIATALDSRVLASCVFSHCSDEFGHARWLRRLGVRPLLLLGLRLGEGSGAALAWPLLDSACRLLAEMASFESAGVSERAS